MAAGPVRFLVTLLASSAFLGVGCAGLLGDFELGGSASNNDGGGSDSGSGADVTSDDAPADATPDAPFVPFAEPVRVAAGVSHTCAVVLYHMSPIPSSDRRVLFCWGSNALGQLGDVSGAPQPSRPKLPTKPNQPDPAEVLNVVASGSGNSTCALDAHGHAWCWGQNGSGQLGLAYTNPQEAEPSKPVIDMGASPVAFTRIFAGGSFVCGVRAPEATDGAVLCWGGNQQCQLAFQQPPGSCPSTVASAVTSGGLGTIPNPNAFSAGAAHSCALSSVGNPYCWGNNGSAQCGSAGPGTVMAPTPVPGGSSTFRFDKIAVGEHHSVALDTGNLWGWGDNTSGAAVPGFNPGSISPTRWTGAPAVFTEVFAGANETCAIGSAGSGPPQLFCFGDNNKGQLGRTSGPVSAVAGLRNITAVAVGGSHVCAIGQDSTGPQRPELFCWGNNLDGQLGFAGDALPHGPTKVVLPAPQ